MNKRVIFGLFSVILLIFITAADVYGNDEPNRRLLSCTPSKDLRIYRSTIYQISGLTGSTCIYRIQFTTAINKPDLICKVPKEKLPETISFNPITVQNLRNKYCVISIKSYNKPRSVYF